MKIRWKIFIPVVVIITTVFLVVILLLSNNFKKYSITQGKLLAKSYSKQVANKAQAVLSKDMSAMRTLADAFSGFRSIKPENRKYIYENIMTSVLKNHPKYNAVWASWNLNAIDNNWHKPYGRQITVALKKPNGNIIINIDSLDLKQENYASTYYKVKSSENREFIVDPYFFKYNTEDYKDSILMTSLAVHILENNEYRGLVGLDMGLNELQGSINTFLPIENTQTILISNNKTIVIHPNQSYIGKKLDRLLTNKNILKALSDSIAKDKDFSVVGTALNDAGEEFITFTPLVIGEASTPWMAMVAVPLRQITKEAEDNFFNSLLIGLIGTLPIYILIYLASSGIVKAFNEVIKIMDALKEGNFDVAPCRLDTKKDEIGEIARSVNKLKNKMTEAIIFIEKIGEKKLDTEYKLSSQNDRLGKALIKMQDGLKKIETEKVLKEKENKENLWMQNGIITFSEILQENYTEYKSLSNTVVKFLVRHFKIPQIAFFIAKYENRVLKKLHLISAYAYDKTRTQHVDFAVGESLVGRCAEEMKPIIITDIPPDYTNISSGLGNEIPKFLTLIPLINDQKIQGVLELASFKTLPKYKQDFLEVLAERLALEIQNIANNIATKEIFEQLEEQSKLIVEKDNEAKKIINDLENTTEKLNQQRFENEEIIKAFSLVNSIIIFDVEGKVIDINEKKLKILGGKKEDYIGKLHFEVFSKDNTMLFENIWNELMNGKIYEKDFYIQKGNKKLQLHETFVPLKDEKGVVKKIITIGTEINK